MVVKKPKKKAAGDGAAPAARRKPKTTASSAAGAVTTKPKAKAAVRATKAKGSATTAPVMRRKAAAAAAAASRGKAAGSGSAAGVPASPRRLKSVKSAKSVRKPAVNGSGGGIGGPGAAKPFLNDALNSGSGSRALRKKPASGVAAVRAANNGKPPMSPRSKGIARQQAKGKAVVRPGPGAAAGGATKVMKLSPRAPKNSKLRRPAVANAAASKPKMSPRAAKAGATPAKPKMSPRAARTAAKSKPAGPVAASTPKSKRKVVRAKTVAAVQRPAAAAAAPKRLKRKAPAPIEVPPSAGKTTTVKKAPRRTLAKTESTPLVSVQQIGGSADPISPGKNELLVNMRSALRPTEAGSGGGGEGGVAQPRLLKRGGFKKPRANKRRGSKFSNPTRGAKLLQVKSGGGSASNGKRGSSGRTAYINSAMGGMGILASAGSDSGGGMLGIKHSLKRTPSKEENTAFAPELIRFRGNKINEIIPRIVDFGPQSVYDGDVYILNNAQKDIIYMLFGKKSSHFARLKADTFSHKLRDTDCNGRSEIVLFDKGTGSKAFWRELGVKEGARMAPRKGDSVCAAPYKHTDVLYRFATRLAKPAAKVKADTSKPPVAPDAKASGPAGGELVGRLTIVAKNDEIVKTLLVSDGCFILDCFSEVYLWIGSQFDVKSRKLARDKVQAVLARKKTRPSWAKVVHLYENSAPPMLFKEKFRDWSTVLPERQVAPVPKGNIARVKGEFDVRRMSLKASLSLSNISDDLLPKHIYSDNDSGADSDAVGEVKPLKRVSTGNYIDDMLLARKEADSRAYVIPEEQRLKIFHVTQKDKFVYTKDMWQWLFANNSFVILYRYVPVGQNRERTIIYFFQGGGSTVTEKGASAVLTIFLDKELKGEAKQLRVAQGRESEHFLALFSGNLIVLPGAVDGYAALRKTTFMLHCRTVNDAGQLRSVPCELSPLALNSNDVFLLCAPTQLTVWVGKYFKLDVAELEERFKNLADGLGVPVACVREGNEDDAFWHALGAGDRKRLYPQRECSHLASRLFDFGFVEGLYGGIEIVQFAQADLKRCDGALLETDVGVYLWLSDGANRTSTKKLAAMKLSVKYISIHPDASKAKLKNAIKIVHEGREPLEFTAHFQAWDHSRSQLAPPYLPVERVWTTAELLESYQREYTLEELRQRPEGVDASNLEMYLSDGDFEEGFGMDRDEFKKLAVWKREEIKKTLSLY